MSVLSNEEITATQKASLDTSLGLLNAALEGVTKLVELNLQAVKSSLADSQYNLRETLSSRDPQEVIALHARQIQPTVDKIQSYSRHVFAILATTQADVAKVTQTQYEAHTRQVQTLVDNLRQSTPVGSEAALTALKSTITASNTLYETVQRTTQQAFEVAGSNLNAAVDVASKATRHAVERASRVAKT
ncbi:phasin family protein [Burkholderia sp. D7]|nr:phasin family protein [Burkholderia sp. D7]